MGVVFVMILLQYRSMYMPNISYCIIYIIYSYGITTALAVPIKYNGTIYYIRHV